MRALITYLYTTHSLITNTMIKILKSTILLSVLIAMSIAPANAIPAYNLTETDGNTNTIVTWFHAHLSGSVYTDVVVYQMFINGASFFGSTDVLYTGQYVNATESFTNGGGYIHASSPSMSSFTVRNTSETSIFSLINSKVYIHARPGGTPGDLSFVAEVDGIGDVTQSLVMLYLDGAGWSGAITVEDTMNTMNVPEPTSIALLGLGLFGFSVTRRKKNQA